MTLGSVVGGVDPGIAISQYRRAREAVSMSGEGTVAKRKGDEGVAEYTKRSCLN